MTEEIDYPDLHAAWIAGGSRQDAQCVIRDAAYRQFLKHGAQNFSMRRLAASIGISAMTAYRYYADREALLSDLKTMVGTRFGKSLATAINPDAEPVDQLRAAAVAYLSFALENEQDYRLLFDVWIGDTLPPFDSEARQRPNWMVLVELLQRFAPDADMQRITELGHLIWAAVHGLAMLHLSGRMTLADPIEITARPYVEMLVNLAGAQLLDPGDHGRTIGMFLP